jgi:hypothetical protein
MVPGMKKLQHLALQRDNVDKCGCNRLQSFRTETALA